MSQHKKKKAAKKLEKQRRKAEKAQVEAMIADAAATLHPKTEDEKKSGSRMTHVRLDITKKDRKRLETIADCCEVSPSELLHWWIESAWTAEPAVSGEG